MRFENAMLSLRSAAVLCILVDAVILSRRLGIPLPAARLTVLEEGAREIIEPNMRGLCVKLLGYDPIAPTWDR